MKESIKNFCIAVNKRKKSDAKKKVKKKFNENWKNVTF